MNTNMHRVTEDLDDRFRQHEGDDLAAFSAEDDAAMCFMRDVWQALLVTLGLFFGCAIVGLFIGWAVSR